MKIDSFQIFLFKSAVYAMACDGDIDNSEIEEIKNMSNNEIHFIGFNYEDYFDDSINYIKANGKDAINEYLLELQASDLKSKQEYILLEILIRVIEADGIIDPNEIQFIQLVLSNLNITDENLITKFPNQIGWLLAQDNKEAVTEFMEDISFIEKESAK